MLRSLQKQKLIKMLSPEDPPFKILILDSATQEILGPILKVSDLRDAGVTAHFLASASRSPIKEAPAFYFVSSAEPIEKDLNRDLYGSYYINSSFAFKRSDLERMAAVASGKQIALKIRSVFDQFVQFVSLQDDLFTLNIANSFVDRNTDTLLRYTVSGLMSVFCTLNEVPFIISKECELGRMLEQKIKSTKIIKGGVRKPLLIILNRDFDVSTPTKHVMGYVELIHDIFNIKLNKADNINIDTDCEFYKANMFLDFPTVADTVNKELHAYRKELALRSLNEKSDKAQIQAALENAPHLQRKSEVVNNNLTLCSKVLDQVKERKMSDFYSMEESFDQNEIMELCSCGTDNDILRLCIQLIGSKNADLVEPILQKRGINSKVVNYFRKMIKDEQGFGAKVKNLLFKKNLPIYSQVESMFSQIKTQNFDGLETYDPSYTGIYQSEVSRIVVYINGGATYSELKSLKELEKVIKIPIVLGGSEVLNANEFIRQVSIENQ